MNEPVNKSFGVISSPSSSKQILVVARGGKTHPNIPSAIGRMAYFDIIIEEETYRAIGSIVDMQTINTLAANTGMQIATSNSATNLGGNSSSDVRTTTIMVQTVFKLNEKDEWVTHGSVLPNSPSTGVEVFLMNEHTLSNMLQGTDYPSVGYIRGMDNAPSPLRLPDFSSKTGATHTSVLGKSGSGKSSFSTFVLAAQMRHESHAIITIDPQGQWSNEKGFLFSLQNFAEGLGRPVSVLRMSEDIRLPLSEELLSKMIDKINLWGKFRRMGSDNREALSQEVAERLVRRNNFNKDPKTVLTEVFADIAQSPAALARIYASADRRDILRDQLLLLANLPLPANEEGVIPIVSQEELDDTEDMWTALLSRFRPIHSLFSPTNFDDGKRRYLGGQKGILEDVLQVRPEKPSTPAPYVIFDMSPNIALHQKAGLNRSDESFGMQLLLDNEDIKACILLELLSEIKKAAEIVFNNEPDANLNTQIVFDEAWRYAGERSDSDDINLLSKTLGGFARDTRKFGIGWTYILQSPGDLRSDIWKQLTYVYAGYGLAGDDVRTLERNTDDVSQIDFYRQFTPPHSSGLYPFMLMGPVSPLIISNSPTFLNSYSNIDEFIENNRRWLRQISTDRSLPMITSLSLIKKRIKKKTIVGDKVLEKTYEVGKTAKRPQSQTGDYGKTSAVRENKTKIVETNDLISDPPF